MNDSDLKKAGFMLCIMMVLFAPYAPQVGFIFLVMWAGVLAFSSVV